MSSIIELWSLNHLNRDESPRGNPQHVHGRIFGIFEHTKKNTEAYLQPKKWVHPSNKESDTENLHHTRAAKVTMKNFQI